MTATFGLLGRKLGHSFSPQIHREIGEAAGRTYDYVLFEKEPEELEAFITRAGLWLDGGTMFGPEGLGFQRINIACPRSLVQQAMEQLREALKTLR